MTSSSSKPTIIVVSLLLTIVSIAFANWDFEDLNLGPGVAAAAAADDNTEDLSLDDIEDFIMTRRAGRTLGYAGFLPSFSEHLMDFDKRGRRRSVGCE